MNSQKICSVFGHRDFKATPEISERLRCIFERLIKDGVTVFLFGSRSNFNNTCWEIITELKSLYPFLKRVLVRAEYPYADKEYVDMYFKYYEEVYMPESVKAAGRSAYVERNQWMIDNSDICVFYYDKAYSPSKKYFSARDAFPYQPKSGTMSAYRYAERSNKEIINVLSC